VIDQETLSNSDDRNTLLADNIPIGRRAALLIYAILIVEQMLSLTYCFFMQKYARLLRLG
ncbi:MAG: hypothetical protein ACRD8W_31545, partial [Nitrososphaeraceae archaeon]